jgi:hypothetical protein
MFEFPDGNDNTLISAQRVSEKYGFCREVAVLQYKCKVDFAHGAY